jgi:putative transposase
MLHNKLLNAYVFRTLSEVREKVQEWMDDYNMYRPHKALGYKSPQGVLDEFILKNRRGHFKRKLKFWLARF